MTTQTKFEVNVYCDESCHLERDESRYMVLGSIRCPKTEAKKYNADIIALKESFNRDKTYEIKWNKIYAGNVDLAVALIDYFFQNDRLKFRGYVIDKRGLDHDKYLQDHDTWYFKMYYKMFEFILELNYPLFIYLDVKDTRSGPKIKRLKEIMDHRCSTLGNIGVKNIQAIQSHEVQLMQLVDLLIGAIRYINEGKIASPNKMRVINRIIEKSGRSLKRNISLSDTKFNVFFWQASYNRGEF